MRGVKRPNNKKKILPFSQNLLASAWHPSFSNILSKLVQISSLQKVTQRGLTSFFFFQNESETERIESKKIRQNVV